MDKLHKDSFIIDKQTTMEDLSSYKYYNPKEDFENSKLERFLNSRKGKRIIAKPIRKKIAPIYKDIECYCPYCSKSKKIKHRRICANYFEGNNEIVKCKKCNRIILRLEHGD